jgi:hypothetical protein
MCRESQLGLFEVLMHTRDLRVSGENLKTCIRPAVASQGSIDHSAELLCPEVQQSLAAQLLCPTSCTYNKEHQAEACLVPNPFLAPAWQNLQKNLIEAEEGPCALRCLRD